MEPETERTLNRVFGTPAAHPSPGLRHEPPLSDMTAEQNAIMATWLMIYMECANMAISLAYLLQARSARAEMSGRTIRNLDVVVDRIGIRGNDARLRSILTLRDDLSRETTPLPPEVLKAGVKAINNLLDGIAPLEPLVNSILKYTTKLQLAQEAIARVYDTLDDIKFARSFAMELDG